MSERDPEKVRDISEKIYRLELDRDTPDHGPGRPGGVKRMLEKDGDGGVKLRNRAKFYDRLTREYLDVLNLDDDGRPK